MTTPADIRLRHIVEQCAVALTDADGRFRKNDLIEAVLEHLAREDLAPDLMVAALSKLAQSAVTGWGEEHNPRRWQSTGRFFHPRSVMKLGNGIWVWMGRSTDSDMVQWRRLSRKNRARVDRADDEVQDYSDEVLDAYRAHRDILCLEDLERVAFGWSEDQVDQAVLF
ncbi:hypothetical protein [Streptomyces caeruleatus]|uniref:Uncharacterized protein n=1 Tax=Streptomyces caeruleatus TaxID=661399 RepID=A0A101U5J2_9ACTN|nr:hypothetical protein [Streptomyces caeruleatus]KUO04601.1 hypothetical protein AQJ67_10360 [Streptomyces caeruleatus]